MLLVAYAFGIRGELVRRMRPSDLRFVDGKLWFSTSAASKADQSYLASPPQGRQGLSLLSVVNEVLAYWLGALPADWDGLLFPKVTQGAHKGGPFHLGHTWVNTQVRDHNAYIRRLAGCLSLPTPVGHSTQSEWA